MSVVTRFFGHPAVGIIGSLASVISVPLAFYFYRASIQAPDVTFHVHPVRASLVKTGQTSQLTVLFNGKQIDTEITAVQVAIWNAGKTPIRPSDILSPITLQTTNGVPILAASIRKTSRPVIALRLEEGKLAAGTLGVSWDILERNDGGVIQIIYGGPADTQITAVGAVVGQPQVQELKYSADISSPEEQYLKTARKNKILGWITLCAGVVFAFLVTYRFIERRREGSLTKTWLVILPLMPLIYFVLGALLLYKSQIPGPPFGF